MLDKLKSVLEELDEKVGDISSNIGELADKIEDDSSDLRKTASGHLRNIEKRITEARSHLKTEGEEAEVQAHLAAMEAHDSWLKWRDTAVGLFNNAKQGAAEAIDRAQLQASLAKMEVRDFYEANQEEYKRTYSEAKEKVEEATIKAATEFKKDVEKIIADVTS